MQVVETGARLEVVVSVSLFILNDQELTFSPSHFAYSTLVSEAFCATSLFYLVNTSKCIDLAMEHVTIKLAMTFLQTYQYF